jgi:hypothetical protein
VLFRDGVVDHERRAHAVTADGGRHTAAHRRWQHALQKSVAADEDMIERRAHMVSEHVGYEPSHPAVEREQLCCELFVLAEDPGNLRGANWVVWLAPEPFSRGLDANDTVAKSREFCEAGS